MGGMDCYFMATVTDISHGKDQMHPLIIEKLD
jgi:hypothetical protein